jgi:hypothetical protein
MVLFLCDLSKIFGGKKKQENDPANRIRSQARAANGGLQFQNA